MTEKSTSRQFSYYLVAAGIGYIVDFGGLFILHGVLGIYYLLSTMISFALGLIVVYILSNQFVFRNSKITNKSLEIGAFALVGVIGLGILSLLMWLLVDLGGLNYLLAKIFATIVVYIWNFFARRSLYHN